MALNFDVRIKDLAGSIVNQDGTPAADESDFMIQAMQDACQDVARHAIKQSLKDIHMFVKRETITTAQSVDEWDEIISVERDSGEVRAIHYSERFGATDSNSVSFATTNDPAWYVSNGELVLLPDFGTTSYAYVIPQYTITNLATTTLTDFPAKYYDHAITFAAYKVLCRRELDLHDVIRNYTQVEEDVELAGSAANALQLIVQKKQVMLEKYHRIMEMEVTE